MKRFLPAIVVVLLIVQSLLLVGGILCRRPGIDEAWIAEWAWFEAAEGHARSELFRGYCQYGDRVVLIHRLFVLVASRVISVAGFHLWILRSWILCMSAGLLFLVWKCLRRMDPDGIPLASPAILLLFPLFFRAAGFFRPEIMYALLGFGSFMLAVRRPGERLWQAASGLLAGLAVVTHIGGAVFLVSGIVLAVWERRPKDLVPYLAGAVVAILPWLLEIILHYDLFLIQVRGELVTAKTSFSPLTLLLNLMDEHKRLFRNPESTTATVLVITSLLATTRDTFRRNSGLYRYFLVAAVVMGIIVSTKTVTYTVPLLPFGAVCFGLAVADWWSGRPLLRFRRTRRGALAVVAVLTTVMGLGGGISTVAGGLYSPEAVNTLAGELIPEGSDCLAPLHFVFGQVHRLRIGSIYLWRTLSEDEYGLSMEGLLEYARDRNTGYIVLDDYWLDRIEDGRSFLAAVPDCMCVTDIGELLVLEVTSPIR